MDKWITSNLVNFFRLSSFLKISKKKADEIKQTDLIDWLDNKLVIRQPPPAQHTQHRAFIINQLKPIIHELEAMGLSPLAIAEAMAHYQKLYFQKAQNAILCDLKPTE